MTSPPPFRLSLSSLQPLGRALMLPIAVLPAAGLMLRLGQPDLLNIPFVAAAGDAIFHNLGLLFAIGVAVGFAKDGNGAAGLAGVVCFLVATNGAEALITAPPEALAGLAGKARDLGAAAFKAAALFKLSVPLGILSGLIAGDFYNRFGNLKLPDFLAFFGGRRFVPIVSGAAGLVLALIFGLGWTSLDQGIDALSRAIVGAGPFGLFVYGLLNRLLIVTGLHHILNNIAWFIVGDYHGATGDLNRFFAGDPTAGAFMSGFFPVMMFGLPAACLAMFTTARPERKAAVGGMLLSLALTSFLTGVTEPIEFTFMFLAPWLYALHAVLTGASMVIMDLLRVKLGFGFSAGLFDYVLNFGKATRPLLLIPVGLVYFGLYYGLFRFFILRFDLKTPGREPDEEIAAAPMTGEADRARAYVAALGGAANLVSVDACTTRLRLVVTNQAGVDEPALKRLGARGLVRPSPRDLQVVLGPIADQVAREMKASLAGSERPTPAPVLTAPPPPAAAPMPHADAAAVLAALGGQANVREVATCSSRLRIDVADAVRVDEAALRALGVRGVVKPSASSVQVVVGPSAEALASDLKGLLPA
ncbi:MAG TPA: N-acetylglucosamine-specific PTS transporter subunit IIBC [Caulobacteraceae bacterium]|jgi:PTS system N-acetylglucosamine-specific IIC component|nr:N-acetylglucosamine-specific PTS transporter subunit IIBC [Caulobacteraceae bacterium]